MSALLSPDRALWLRDEATVALIVHIACGCLGLLTGAAALALRKGGRLHRASGNVFFLSMFAMGAMAALLGLIIPDRGNIPGGLFTMYLVATGWATVRRKDAGHGRLDYGAPILALSAAGLALMFAVQAADSPTGLLDRKPAPLYGIFASLAVFAAALDLKIIVRPGLSGKSRIVRHIWRMTTALFFASGSFFLGQQKVMPRFVQGSPLLIALAIAPLGAMIFWLIRINFNSRLRRRFFIPLGLGRDSRHAGRYAPRAG